MVRLEREILVEKGAAPNPMISGLRYVPGFLDAAVHDSLLAAADAGPWRHLAARRMQIYGYSYDLRKGGVYRVDRADDLNWLATFTTTKSTGRNR